MDKLKEFVDTYNVKDKAKKTGKVLAVGVPVVGIIAIGYFGLKTSKSPDYIKTIGR